MFSLQFSDWSDAAWGMTFDVRMLMFAAGITVSAGGGQAGDYLLAAACLACVDPVARWKVDEIMVVGRAAAMVASVFGIDAIRGVYIERWHNALFWGVYFGTPATAWEGGGTIYVNDSAFPDAEQAMIHELGHYVQESHPSLLNEFVTSRAGQAPTEYGTTNDYEDFADSFQVFVYQYLGIPIEGYNAQHIFGPLTVDSSRWSFFSLYTGY